LQSLTSWPRFRGAADAGATATTEQTAKTRAPNTSFFIVPPSPGRSDRPTPGALPRGPAHDLPGTFTCYGGHRSRVSKRPILASCMLRCQHSRRHIVSSRAGTRGIPITPQWPPPAEAVDRCSGPAEDPVEDAAAPARRLGVAGAPAALRNAGPDLSDVLAATGPGGLAARPARHCSAHGQSPSAVG
jgi:hypothetical protein